MSARGTIGIVIPAFGHPRLLAEAITSACTQEIDASLKVVVVDDGCLQHETRDVIQASLDRFRGTLYSVRQVNTRLPGARNTGIEFLLTLDPHIDSVYLLDADNRLPPSGLKRFREALGDDPEVGWAYPDIGFFGFLPHAEGLDVRETAPEYSVLKHLTANISEAGSLVRGEMLRKGLRFDESLTVGFEDWDFWLRALSLGYKGVRALDTGFAYRKRPESMLAEASRQHEQVLAAVTANHKKLFSRAFIDEVRHREAPTFAVVRVSGVDPSAPVTAVSCFFDPGAEHNELSESEFIDWVQRKLKNRREHFFPSRIVVIEETAWQQIHAHSKGLLDLFARISRLPDRSALVLEQSSETKATLFSEASVPFLERLAARKAWDLVDGHTSKMSWNGALPARADTTAVKTAYDRVTAACFLSGAVKRNVARRYAGPDADTVLDHLSKNFGRATPLAPLFSKIRKPGSILLSVPERCLRDETALEELVALIERDAKPENQITLCVECLTGTEPSVPARLAEVAADIIPFPLDPPLSHSMMYLGRDLEQRLSDYAIEPACAIVSAFPVIWAPADSAMIEVFGYAREDGSQTRVLASPALGGDHDLCFARIMAYEHAILDVCGAGQAMSDRLRAAGLPYVKLMTERRTERLHERATKPEPLPHGWRPAKGFVFVVTHGRSGSTALTQILNAFKGYHVRGENNHILPPLLEFLDRVEGIAANADVYRSHLSPSPWEGCRTIRPDTLTEQTVQMVMRDVWGVPKDAVRVGFKEIRYTDMPEQDLFQTLDRLKQFFAPAKIIFNIRPVEETVRSSWYADADTAEATRDILAVQRRFQYYADQHPEDALLLDHAAYRDNPDELRPLCSFLGEAFEPERLREILSNRLSH